MTENSVVRLLFVEDDPDIRMIAEMVLGASGHFLLKLCQSGREAIKEAPEFKPDLFILDMMMPEMNGIDTLKALREIPVFQSTPVIFMTAKAQSSEVDVYKKMGALDVIRKPFEPMALPHTILDIYSRRNKT